MYAASASASLDSKLQFHALYKLVLYNRLDSRLLVKCLIVLLRVVVESDSIYLLRAVPLRFNVRPVRPTQALSKLTLTKVIIHRLGMRGGRIGL